jgi:hypothetical protein
MVFVSKRRRLVIHIAPIVFVFAIGWSVVLIFYARPHGLTQTLVSVLSSCLFLAVALSLQRMVRRVGDHLDVWTVLGRRRLPAKRVFLGITSKRRSIEIALFLGKTMEPTEPAVPVASFPSLGLDEPRRAASRMADVLDMPQPRIAPWIEAGP